MITVKEEQFRTKVTDALKIAAQRIIVKSTQTDLLRELRSLQLEPGLLDGTQQINFLDNLEPDDLSNIFKNVFKEANIPVSQFEYSVSCNAKSAIASKLEVHSSNFYVINKSNHLEFSIPVIAESGSAYESIVGQGGIHLVILDNKSTIIKPLNWMIAGGLLFTIIIITAFYLTLSTMLKQKKISEIKSDFINNMTHEFKTPLATISLAVDALKNEKVQNDPVKSAYFTSIIKDENKRMNKQVESILQAALLDKQELQLNLKRLHLNQIVENAFSYFKIILEQQNGTADIQLKASNDSILGDEVHITNLVRNLLDNAIKYCKPDTAPHLRISTVNTKSHIQLFVEDNGIGMSKETTTRIFEKFYRAHTGNVHNVKGFGLGLTYVKAIVDAHKGKIKVDSVFGKGSVFTIELPISVV
jgi:two-component system phosphate regulon sensor histidine kinase PhoR